MIVSGWSIASAVDPDLSVLARPLSFFSSNAGLQSFSPVNDVAVLCGIPADLLFLLGHGADSVRLGLRILLALRC